MKKRLIVVAAGAALLVGGAAAAIPGASAHGFTKAQCTKIVDGAAMQGDQAGPFVTGHLTLKQFEGLFTADIARMTQVSATGCPIP